MSHQDNTALSLQVSLCSYIYPVIVLVAVLHLLSYHALQTKDTSSTTDFLSCRSVKIQPQQSAAMDHLCPRQSFPQAACLACISNTVSSPLPKQTTRHRRQSSVRLSSLPADLQTDASITQGSDTGRKRSTWPPPTLSTVAEEAPSPLKEVNDQYLDLRRDSATLPMILMQMQGSR